ncbi:unnamed protein product [Symbiodinium natans]|uniref:Uncharacterized protein n=1 Tax=Symbiodinium natans TaxID=878477 RepID=A0A812M720_9DINO|nr:unnamed protein product [Symbiodinium natans]
MGRPVVLMMAWLLILGASADMISQGLDEDACATQECAVKLLQLGARKEGPALAEESKSHKSQGFGPGPCKATGNFMWKMQKCAGLEWQACSSQGCIWEPYAQGGNPREIGFGSAPCRALSNIDTYIQPCSGKDLQACRASSSCIWNPWAFWHGGGSGGWNGGGGWNDLQCEGKPFNLVGDFECNGLAPASCNQNSNCQLVRRGGGNQYRYKCQGKPMNFFGFECDNLSASSCRQNSNCELVRN